MFSRAALFHCFAFLFVSSAEADTPLVNECLQVEPQGSDLTLIRNNCQYEVVARFCGFGLDEYGRCKQVSEALFNPRGEPQSENKGFYGTITKFVACRLPEESQDFTIYPKVDEGRCEAIPRTR